MIKRVAVAGCRHYENYEEAKKYIDFCISEIRKKYTIIFVSGGCRGADALGERYAAENGFMAEIYPAVWEKYGRAAGPKRNKKSPKSAIILSAFGTGKARVQNHLFNLPKKQERL